MFLLFYSITKYANFVFVFFLFFFLNFLGGIFCFIQLPSIYFFFLNLYVNWAILLIFLLYSIYQISFSALLYWVVYLWAQSPVQCTYMTLELYTFMPYHQEMFTFTPCHREMFIFMPCHQELFIFMPYHQEIFTFMPYPQEMFTFMP